MQQKSNYTLFTIKNDAIERNIDKDIMDEISKYYKIINTKRKILSRKEVEKIKEYEWNHNWDPKPTRSIKELSFAYEAKEVIILLCQIKDINIDAINFGDKLKGDHHVAHLCSQNTLRGKFVDKSIIDRVKIDKNGVSVLYDKTGKKISLAPNVVHSVDCREELILHLSIFFPESKDLIDL